jgi:hypothetical protein
VYTQKEGDETRAALGTVPERRGSDPCGAKNVGRIVSRNF